MIKLLTNNVKIGKLPSTTRQTYFNKFWNKQYHSEVNILYPCIYAENNCSLV